MTGTQKLPYTGRTAFFLDGTAYPLSLHEANPAGKCGACGGQLVRTAVGVMCLGMGGPLPVSDPDEVEDATT